MVIIIVSHLNGMSAMAMDVGVTRTESPAILTFPPSAFESFGRTLYSLELSK